ncbi:MAG: UvrD-helicase domain-containing protein, partial [Nitrospiraceae bacterium]|nr:UvrD-helicase domain-containing protein [Nitrospiraceae bacterium]
MAAPILNEAQLEAVTADDGPALVLAGAGSGKTRVIVERLVWLIEERGVDPRNLLALTFTNRAAGEMKSRVAERLGVDRIASWVGTFHSFGLYVLRREIDRLGRPKAFTVFDDSDQLSLMRRLVRGLPEGYAKVTPRRALSWMSRLKQDLKEPNFGAPSPMEDEETCRELWKRYHDTLLRVSAVDFDDLLSLVVRLFEEHADVREKYGRRYQYVLVDEYQDTNRAQYLIAQHLSKDHGNLFVVGDEDQSIYSWRGAHIRNILDFERDFPGARTFRLEQNYRSTAPILTAANAVVANNKARLGKTLRTDQTKGDPVRFYLGKDAADEARWVIADQKESGFAPKDTAILYRTNAQARILEEELRRKGVPYVIVGGVRFYSRKEIKDILCYLRLLVNAADDESLRRIVNVPARGIGATTMARFEEYAAARRIPLFEVLREIEHDESLTARARRSATSFVHLIDDLAVEARTSSVEELTESLLEKTRYREFLKES